MSDLVERLRDQSVIHWSDGEEAADRIEQLERELVAARLATQHANDHADAAIAQLVAEKDLADRLHFALTNNEHADINAVFAAYRKARGL